MPDAQYRYRMPVRCTPRSQCRNSPALSYLQYLHPVLRSSRYPCTDAAAATAGEAADIDLYGRLGEREVRRTQSRGGTFTEDLLYQYFQHTFRSHRVMVLSTTRPSIWVNIGEWVASSSERNTLPGLRILMGASGSPSREPDLRSLGSKQEFRRQVEGILHVSCGVILRGIQCGKVVIIGLDLGSFIYAEAMDAKISISWLRTWVTGWRLPVLRLFAGMEISIFSLS